MTPLILVTGATGYVGGELLKALLAAGHRVRCVSNALNQDSTSLRTLGIVGSSPGTQRLRARNGPIIMPSPHWTSTSAPNTRIEFFMAVPLA
ncbi:MAG: NAD(P)-dependent oxidoreductase [Acidimicrobiia bacterium]|nr:NAD(P)-dependent oxidoreductase [Acidimicrobiia bacterium]